MRFKEDYDGTTVNEIEFNHEGLKIKKVAKGHQKLSSFLKEVFLPEGYPNSVSRDYLTYQFWDTLQELCSTLNGTLASHAIFQGMGVGNSKASALGATYTWLMKDGTGMISNILFAWSKGTLLDIDAKRWRLFADVLNDIAMFLDLLSPLAPPYLFTFAMCCTSVFRSLVGVAGGCTRATIKQHQAQCNNMADVSAKDGSQEKLSGLLGLVLSMTLINIISVSPLITWTTFSLLTVLHLYFNYRACSCLVMKSLNPTRYKVLLEHWFREGSVLNPEQVNCKEPFILGHRGIQKRLVIGASLEDLDVSRSRMMSELETNESRYIIYSFNDEIRVCLRSGSNHRDQIEAYHLAYMAALQSSDSTIFLPNTDQKSKYQKFLSEMSQEGWDLSFSPLGASQLRYSPV
ncbi:hypothetical protein ACHWQZ_G014907 [Mnemiopsis leidyi]